jgi:hypothetical protein
MSIGEAYRDPEGVVCVNPDDAEGHARMMASELVRLLGDEFRSDERLKTISVLVTDERGNEITRAPLQFGKRWRH